MSKLDYVAADEAKLTEILRQAESRLGSQLSVGIAADQRAMTFAGILSAIAAALVAYGAEKGAGISLIVMTALLLLGAASAAWAARPIPWSIYGTAPSDWIDDIAEGKDDLKSAKAAMADFYDEMIGKNRDRLANAGTAVDLALLAAVLAPLAGGITLLLGF